jgi:calreticulin
MDVVKGEFSAGHGLKTTQDAKFYAVATKFTPFNNRDRDLVISFSVQHNPDCGGAYIKLLPEFDLTTFNGETQYAIMFGPDVCGATKKLHFIINRNGANKDWKKSVTIPTDAFTHFYTAVIHPDNSYEVLIDFKSVASGKLEDDWDLLPPQTITDPEDKKPSDWVDQAEIVDPEDKKPEGWDAEPATVPDPDATKPDDWDEEEDGEWEAPTIPNPKYKGEWKPKMIPNPKYKGEWKARQIPNPEYSPDSNLYQVAKDISALGFDLWQVRSGSLFDNIVIATDLEDAKKTFSAADLEAEKAKFEAKKSAEAASTKPAASDEDDEEEEEDEDEEAEKKPGGRHDEL